MNALLRHGYMICYVLGIAVGSFFTWAVMN